MSKYKIGDKVKIADFREMPNEWPSYNNGMFSFIGKEDVVTRVSEFGDIVVYELDNIYYTMSDDESLRTPYLFREEWLVSAKKRTLIKKVV